MAVIEFNSLVLFLFLWLMIPCEQEKNRNRSKGMTLATQDDSFANSIMWADVGNDL